MGERVRLRGTGRGAHSAWHDEGSALIVEWHDFGEDAPYESANMIRFDAASQEALALAARFRSYFEIRAFAEAEAIPFEAEVDFRP